MLIDPTVEVPAVPAQIIRTLTSRLSGASEAGIRLELANTILEFLTETLAWRTRITATVSVGVTEYELDPGGGTRVITPLELFVGGQRHAPVAVDFYPEADDFRKLYTMVGDFETVRLWPAPTEELVNGLEFYCAIAPAVGDIEIPLTLASKFHTALLEGTMAQMLAQQSRPYSNPKQALLMTRRFRMHITRARRAIDTGYARAGVAWAYPQLAPGRRTGGSIFPGGL